MLILVTFTMSPTCEEDDREGRRSACEGSVGTRHYVEQTRQLKVENKLTTSNVITLHFNAAAVEQVELDEELQSL